MGIYETHALSAKQGSQATQVLSDDPLVGQNNQIVPRNLKLKTMENVVFDPIIQDRIEVLQEQKKEALKVEDFDYCKQVKQFIDKLKIIGNQLINMTAEKDLAIENEDYEIAK